MNTVTAKCLGTPLHLNENEKGQISANKLEGKSLSFIARELRNYLKDLSCMAPEKCPGHPLKITNTARHWLFQEASKGQSSLRDLQKSQNLSITPRRVCQLLHELPNFVYQNKETAPDLTAKHKKMHVDWVKKKVTWTKEKWETMVFSNEKKI